MRVADAVIAADQRHDLAPIEGFISGRDFFRQVLRHHPVGIALEEEGRGYVENLGDVVKPARRYPDIAGFVFLNGLERHADLAGEGALAEAKLDAPQPHPTPDINIDGMRLVILARNDHSSPPAGCALHRLVRTCIDIIMPGIPRPVNRHDGSCQQLWISGPAYAELTPRLRQ